MTGVVPGPRLQWWARGLFAVALAGVAWTSLAPADDLPPMAWSVSDKIIHVAGYAVLGALAALSGLRWLAAVVVVTVFGLALEVAQGATGYRSFEWADLLADAGGAAAGAGIVVALVSRARRRRAAVVGE